MIGKALLTALLLAVPFADAMAQEQAPRPELLRVVRVDSDSIAQAAAWRTGYSMDLVRLLEVSAARRSYWKEGAVAGLIVGTGVAYLLLNSGGSNAMCDRSANQDAISSGECLGLYAAGGAAGAGLGALIGSAIRRGID